jgi:hypothetical protein
MSKHRLQIKILEQLSQLSLSHKWNDLNTGLKYLNENCNRYYINPYWKVNKI